MSRNGDCSSTRAKTTFLPKYRDHVGRKYVLGASPFMSSRKRVVICGGGAIGAAVACFASRRGALPIVIERHEVAGAASGKSGGFLALDWCSGSPLDRLARRSFELHAELSSELGDPWGYRRLTTYSGYAAKDDAARGPPARPWLAGGVTITGRLGSAGSTAVVDPRAFTTGLMRAAKMHGAVLRQLRVPTWRFLDSHFADIGRRSTIEIPVQPEPALVE